MAGSSSSLYYQRSNSLSLYVAGVIVPQFKFPPPPTLPLLTRYESFPIIIKKNSFFFSRERSSNPHNFFVRRRFRRSHVSVFKNWECFLRCNYISTVKTACNASHRTASKNKSLLKLLVSILFLRIILNGGTFSETCLD